MESGFFDKYPLFYKTARASKVPERLNIRYKGLIEKNKDLLVNKKILDLASHDGRWSFAALEVGAHSVIGIEGREELVSDAYSNFKSYGIDPSKYRFYNGDISKVLNENYFDVDIIFCFGFLYHTSSHIPLFVSLKNLNPIYIIIDTKISLFPDCVVELILENSNIAGNAIEDLSTSNSKKTIVGKPSRLALYMLFKHFGYKVNEVDWSNVIDEQDCVRDYKCGERITLIAHNLEKAIY